LVAVVVFGGLLANRLAIFSPNDLILDAKRDHDLTEAIDSNLAVFGQSVQVSSRVSGNALFGADTVTIEGEIERDLTVIAENVTFTGTVAGDAVFFAENIVLGGAVSGELIAITPNLQIQDDFTGRVVACAEVVSGGSDATVVRECDQRVAQALISRAGTQLASAWLVSLLGNTQTAHAFDVLRMLPFVTFLAGVGALLVTIFPRPMSNIQTTVRANPGHMLATGGMMTLLVVGTSAAYLLLVVYLAPVALLLAPLYLLLVVSFGGLLAAGWVTFTLIFGDWLARRLWQKMLPPLVTAVLGGVVLAAGLYGLSWLPLGNLLAGLGFLLMGLAGLGATYATRLGRRAIIAT
jgi:hypothetical protein